VDALLQFLVGGLADEHGAVVLGLDLHLENVGRDVAAVIAGLDGRVDALRIMFAKALNLALLWNKCRYANLDVRSINIVQ
jgi:hypothetical protein